MIILNRLRVSRFKQLKEIDLRFPERGTVLVEGHNEAGKSSLFEAVVFALYGQPLINDRDYKIEDLKQYGAEDMEVILDFTVNERPFSITRRFGKRHSAKLVFPSVSEGEAESITVLSEIDKRLNEELRLSFDALLNTCFVEQKRLERLEDLNPNARQETINELLNLKVLTRLQSEFKVSGEDRNTLKRQKLRVGIAELDDLWPRLHAETELAVRCQHWKKWHEEELEQSRLQKQFADAKETETALIGQCAEIERQLSDAARLRSRLDLLQGETKLSLQAWKEAEERLLRSQSQVERLQELQELLPALEQKGQENAQLAKRLEELEQAAQEAQALETKAQEIRAQLEERKELEAAFEQSNRLSEQYENERVQAQSTLEDAEGLLEKHRGNRDRINGLEIWLARQEKLQTAQKYQDEALRNLRIAQKEAALLEASEKALVQLRIAREKVVLLLEAEQGIAQEKQNYLLQNELESARASLKKSEVLYEHARHKLQEVQQRVALENWEKGWRESSHPAASPLEELKIREEKTGKLLESAEREATREARKQKIGWALSGAALLILVAGFVLKLSLPGGGLALVLAGLGAWILVNAMRATRQAREEYSRCYREMDALKGERRALESQAEAAVQRHLTEPERALETLGIAVPESAAEAQKQIARLPQSSLEAASSELSRCESSVREASVQKEIASRALKEYQSTLERSSGSTRLTQEDWKSKRENAHSQFEGILDEIADPELRELLQTVRDGDDLRLQTALQTAQHHFNCARTAKEELPEKESALERAQSAHQTAIRERAETLQKLQENALEEGEVRTEIIRLQAKQGSATEAALVAQVAQARAVLAAVQNQISVLTARKQQQRERLEAISHGELTARLNDIEDRQKACESTLEELRALRESIEKRGLPETYAALIATLAGQREVLLRMQQEAETLANAPEMAADSRREIASIQTQFARSWQRVFPDAKTPSDDEETPSDVATAVTRLPQKAELLESKLAESDEEKLKSELMQLQKQLREILDHIATLQHRRSDLQKKILELRLKLDATELQSADEFLEAHPELICAPERSAAQWEDEVQARRETATDNRSTRRTRAEAIGEEELLADSLLELKTERELLQEQEDLIAVKLRAGEIVEETRASIVKRVMPLTMQNIRQLLPLLTNRRYQDAEWDEEKNWILIYDSQARELVRKRTFSGGARDQISLALRLSFALATLPSEHNTRPGFLFLDEPLSSFDRERTRALVDLLTRGLIRRRFSQIFLISHSDSFDPALFDYRLRLEGGQITLNTLPT